MDDYLQRKPILDWWRKGYRSLRILAAIMAFLGLLTFANVSDAVTYYVDSQSGDNSYAGTSETEAWRTISRVNLQHYSPGDELLFRRGGEWTDVNICINTASLKIGAYSVGPAPRLLGSIPVAGWKKKTDGIFFKFFPRPASHKDWAKWDVQLVMEEDHPYGFYKKVDSYQALGEPGSFYYNTQGQKLYVRPFDADAFPKKRIWVGRQDNIVELRSLQITDLTVRDLEISLSNRYGIGPWWQGDKQTQGTIIVENNNFIGNAFSAVCLSGGMSFERILIRNNRIRKNGAEGIYIGKHVGRKAVEITNNEVGDPVDKNFGWRGEGPQSAFNGDGIEVKTGNRGVLIGSNRIRNLTGYCGICTGSSDALVIDNEIADIRMPGSEWPAAAAGVYFDVDDSFGVIKVVENRMKLSEADGIHVRGKYDLHPGAVIEANDIELTADNPNAQIEFTVMNSRNVQIISNRGSGGAYGLAFNAAPAYPPVGYVIVGNEFLNTTISPFFFSQNNGEDLNDLKLEANKVCTDSPVFIQWKSGEKVNSFSVAKKLLGEKSIVGQKCP